MNGKKSVFCFARSTRCVAQLVDLRARARAPRSQKWLDIASALDDALVSIKMSAVDNVATANEDEFNKALAFTAPQFKHCAEKVAELYSFLMCAVAQPVAPSSDCVRVCVRARGAAKTFKTSFWLAQTACRPTFF